MLPDHLACDIFSLHKHIYVNVVLVGENEMEWIKLKANNECWRGKIRVDADDETCEKNEYGGEWGMQGFEI